MTHVSRVLVLAVVLVLTAGCGEKDASAPVEPGVRAEASVAKGGLLYDKFWKVSPAGEPKDTHPLWAKRPDPESNERTGSDTWRCKECHGWDYKGVGGAYAKGSHRTGFEGVLGSTSSAAEIATSLAEAHGYRAAGLSELEIDDLVRFVREALVDTSAWIDENGAFRGDAKRGKQLYLKGLGSNKACTVCHGPDGLKAPKGAKPGYADFVGKIAGKNPWEFLHKVRFGQPGSKMPAAVRGGASMQDIVDVGAYAQTLPKAR